MNKSNIQIWIINAHYNLNWIGFGVAWSNEVQYSTLRSVWNWTTILITDILLTYTLQYSSLIVDNFSHKEPFCSPIQGSQRASKF